MESAATPAGMGTAPAGPSDPAGLVEDSLAAVVGAAHVRSGRSAGEDYEHDEGLTTVRVRPLAVACPRTTEEVADIVRWARRERVPLVARGSATGLSGGAAPVEGSVVVSFERMRDVLEVDEADLYAVVQPGVTLRELDEVLAPQGLLYPVYPGEQSASVGGNVATNAGGMRAVRYGVTRHHVLGLEVVLGTGEVLRTGGKVVKCSTGYDLTQLVVGSEGTLALVTEVTVKLQPRLGASATLLAPFETLRAVTAAVPALVRSGLAPAILEYLDALTFQATTAAVGLDAGVAPATAERALAYLLVVVEQTSPQRLEEDVGALASMLAELGALDVYVLPPGAGARLVEARERAFYTAKAAGAHDIVDVVVPRSRIHDLLEAASARAAEHGALLVGCAHAGDGNVHLSVFQPDVPRREALLGALFREGLALGGAISGEHGIGTAKRRWFLELEDPVRLDLLRRLKAVFDPDGILNPGKLL
jgi:glycolate oxidase